MLIRTFTRAEIRNLLLDIILYRIYFCTLASKLVGNHETIGLFELKNFDVVFLECLCLYVFVFWTVQVIYRSSCV